MTDPPAPLPSVADARVGGRVPRPDLALSVVVSRRTRWFARRPAEVVAPVIDLSVTGARLRFDKVPDVRAGTRLAVYHGSARGLVVVRHLETTASGTECGVEFVDLEDALRDIVYERIAGDGDDDWRWDGAR